MKCYLCKGFTDTTLFYFVDGTDKRVKVCGACTKAAVAKAVSEKAKKC